MTIRAWATWTSEDMKRRWLAFAALILIMALTAVVCSYLLDSREPGTAVLSPPQTEHPGPRTDPLPSAGAARAPAEDVVAAALRGEIPAQSRMCSDAMLHAEMSGDYRDAAYWCALAAHAGDAPSQAAYARLYQLGAGVAQDEAQAASWYEKAIDQQNAHAMYMRGRMLIANDTPADHSLGVGLLQRAAALGDANARWALHGLGEAPEARPEQPLVR